MNIKASKAYDKAGFKTTKALVKSIAHLKLPKSLTGKPLWLKFI